VSMAPERLGDSRVLSPLGLLTIRDFRVWWLGFVVSTVAASAQVFGVGWLVVELAGRSGGPGTAAFYLGMVGLARALPAMALGAFGGVASDRYDRRNVLVAAQGVMGATGLVTGLLIVADAMSITVLLVLSALYAVAATFYHPARVVIQPRLVGDANLMGAIGLNATALSTSALVGPLIGGALVLAIGVGGLILACGIATVAVAVALATLRPQPVNRADAATGSVLRSFAEGVSYARRTPEVRWLLIVFTSVTLLARPLPFMLPAFAGDVLEVGPRQLSWLVAAAGAGAILVGLVMTWLRRSTERSRLAVFVAVAAGISLAALAMQRSFLPTLLLVATTQFCIMLSCSLVGVLLQTTTPDGIRGRVIGIQSLLADAGTDCGTFLLGAVGGAVGISAALGAGGAGLVVAGLAIAMGVPALMRAQRTGTSVAGKRQVDVA
jgi:predicted MFS family arabinose efflux permease